MLKSEYKPICHALPCFAMLYHALPCFAMLCHALPCFAMLCHAKTKKQPFLPLLVRGQLLVISKMHI